MATVEQTTGPWIYQISVGNDIVDETPYFGLAWLKFESAALLGYATLTEVYAGTDYDPVLHSPPRTWRKIDPSVVPPCPSSGRCEWKQPERDAFYTTPRPTALRVEVLPPTVRCGYLLRPGMCGGHVDDYQPCIRMTVA